ncbi:MAG TPA: S53 family peptidase [Solirubrobacterales bacterium]|nr:S53 family peptidase [Solirubrobacterales bacterium]
MRARLPIFTCLCLLVLCLAAVPAGAATGVPVQAAPELPGGASFAGAVAPERQLSLYVALEPRDPAALASFAEGVATPGSPIYGDYLSVPQFAARFGPTPAQVATVRSALAARGLDVGAPSADSLSLPVTATAAEAEAAFGTAIDRVATAGGRVAFANRSAPLVPAAAAPYVQGILGLDNLVRAHRHDTMQSSTSSTTAATEPPRTSVLTGGPQPCAEALQVQQDEEFGYTADQVASAYSLPGFYAQGNFGAGQTVALLEMEPTGPKDIDAYQSCYGTHAEVTYVPVEGGSGEYKKGDDGESALDIEQIIGLAPDVKIRVYEGPNPSEVALLSAYVSDNEAKIMSSSWGICEKDAEPTEEKATNVLLQEAAAQGQSFFVAAGDNGASDCYEPPGDTYKGLQVDSPGTDPFATDVGGTRMAAPTTPPVEYIWNDAAAGEGAGGGGISERFPMPAYQQTASPALNVLGPLSSGTQCGLASGYCRQVPDVSADAAPATGYIVHTEDVWGVTGGTSAAAPLWAAFIALTQASPACGGKPIGFANPALYKIAGEGYAGNFNDITTARPGGAPTTGLFSPSEPYAPGPAYDMATGLGTPIGTSLAASLCAFINPSAPPTVPVMAAKTAPAARAKTPNPAQVSGAHLGNVLKGKPRLTFSLAAREGAKLTNITVGVPPALDVAKDAQALAQGIVVRSADGTKLKFTATSTPGTIRIRLSSPQASVTLKIGFPALVTTPKLAAHIREGRTHKLGLVLTTRESGGTGARLPLTVEV